MEDESICKLCEKKFKDTEELLICNGPCNKKVHSKCVGFTATTLKFYKECDNLLYECDLCQSNPIKMMNESVKKLLSFMCIFNERINRQEIYSESMFKHFDCLNNNFIELKGEIKGEIKIITESVTTTMNKSCKTITYSDTLKTNVAEPVVLVKPKKIQKCSDTRDDLNNKVIQNDNSIESVNNIPYGGIEIKCRSNDELSKIQEKVTRKLGENYNIVVPKLHYPKIKVTNMSEKLTDTEIIDCIKSQNIDIRDAEIKVLSVYEIKNTESFGSIIEIDTKSYSDIMKLGKVKIGMNNCNVYDFVNVMRCYRCCGYNHKSNTCKNKLACLRCGGEHVIKDCVANRSECVNCKQTGEKLKLDFDLNHSAWSRTCPVYQKKIEIKRKRIKYNE